MKKFLSLLLVLAMALSVGLALTACGEKKVSNEDGIAALEKLGNTEATVPETYTAKYEMTGYSQKADKSGLFKSSSLASEVIVVNFTEDLSKDVSYYTKTQSLEFNEDGTEKADKSLTSENWYLKKDGKFWLYSKKPDLTSAEKSDKKIKEEIELDADDIKDDIDYNPGEIIEGIDFNKYEEDENIENLTYSFTKKGNIYTLKMSYNDKKLSLKYSMVFKFNETAVLSASATLIKLDEDNKETNKQVISYEMKLNGKVTLPSDHASYTVDED